MGAVSMSLVIAWCFTWSLVTSSAEGPWQSFDECLHVRRIVIRALNGMGQVGECRLQLVADLKSGCKP